MTLCEINEEYGERFTTFVEVKHLPLFCRVVVKNTYTLDTIPLNKYCVRPVAMSFVEGDTIYFELK